ncbi:integrase [Bacillus velezensis TrigoCor1448]|nr:integrase [Bacillus velezensis TrigoCor1448]
MKFVQGIFGHKNITITSDVYSHISEKLENSSVDCYEEYIVPPFSPPICPLFCRKFVA